ncbi:MAG: anthranilate synthase component II [Holosporales bacterium]|jgi:anthranilate synthase/aminodeoxychorismate synthase-like glutamine amidotransferase
MILLIDNYDSFTYNLVHYLYVLGAEVRVVRNDAITVEAALDHRPLAIVISPGPCTPDEAGISVPLLRAATTATLPVLGVCLGHQALGQAFGGTVIRAPEPVHGKTSSVFHHGTGLFTAIPSPFEAARYHSLIVERATLPEVLTPTAWTEDDLIMGLEHTHAPLFGVQFHPESIASQYGHQLLANFLSLAQGKNPALLTKAYAI